MKALYIEGIGRELVLKEVPVPSVLAPGEALVQIGLTGDLLQGHPDSKEILP